MSFAEAAAAFDDWLSSPLSPDQARYRSKGTMRDCRTKIKALNKFFGRLKLGGIHLGQIREYQKVRFSNERNLWAHPAGADKINQEMGLMLRIMRLGNAYTSDIEKYYQTLQVDECEIPKALSPDEQERFLEVASSRPEWEVVYWYSLLAVHIAFSSDEIRTLRQGDINLTHQIIAVSRKAGKNTHRRREVPLTDPSCIWALNQLMERSYRLAGKSPELHLFPKRLARNQFDGSYHMGETGIRKQFEAVRDAAGVPCFNLNGWRHTAITRMAEAGIYHHGQGGALLAQDECPLYAHQHASRAPSDARHDERQEGHATATRAATTTGASQHDGPGHPGRDRSPRGSGTPPGT
jgi:integrase